MITNTFLSLCQRRGGGRGGGGGEGGGAGKGSMYNSDKYCSLIFYLLCFSWRWTRIN